MMFIVETVCSHRIPDLCLYMSTNHYNAEATETF